MKISSHPTKFLSQWWTAHPTTLCPKAVNSPHDTKLSQKGEWPSQQVASQNTVYLKRTWSEQPSQSHPSTFLKQFPTHPTKFGLTALWPCNWPYPNLLTLTHNLTSIFMALSHRHSIHPNRNINVENRTDIYDKYVLGLATSQWESSAILSATLRCRQRRDWLQQRHTNMALLTTGRWRWTPHPHAILCHGTMELSPCTS